MQNSNSANVMQCMYLLLVMSNVSQQNRYHDVRIGYLASSMRRAELL